MKESVILIQTHPATVALQHSKLAERYHLILLENTDQAVKLCDKNEHNIASVVLGPQIKDPIQTSQRLYAIDKSLSIIILSPADKVASFRKSISFTPFLGGQTVCLSELNIDELISRVEELAEKTTKHRNTKNISRKLNTQLLSIDLKRKNTAPSKEFIERLFDSAPIGIVTVDSEGKILALNKASSKYFELSESQTIGMKITEIFHSLELIPDRVEEVFRDTPAGKLYFEMTITTIKGQDQSPGWLLLLVDITQRKKYELALESAVKSRDDFLSIASHELKTPLTSLKLQAQLHIRAIKRKDPSAYDPENVDEIMFHTEKQINRLTRLVDDMLDVSRIRSGKLTIQREKLNLCDLVEDVIARLKMLFEKSEYTVPDVSKCERAEGHWDRMRIEQVITNLLTNAIRYGNKKPILVSIESENDIVRLIVRDHGIGIDDSAEEIIFDRFERAISSNEVSGLGLGLFITKQIVVAHGGKIWVESVVGQGSRFIVELPKV